MNTEECKTCLGHGRIEDADDGHLRKCLDCNGSGEQVAMAKPKYEVLFGKEWYKCKKAVEVKQGWLHAETYDGTTTLAPPNKWRKVEPNTTATKG